ncbi:hypothetical protein JCM8208_003659 [Rhodotorula glutinis]
MPPRRLTRSKGTNKPPDGAPTPAASPRVDIGGSDDSDSPAASSSPVGTRKVKGTAKAKRKVHDSSDEEPLKPKRRRRHPVQPRLRTDTPSSKSIFSIDLLLKLPFDLVAEICSHLNGGDLLQLSRTCETLHEFLLGPQSSSIWAASRLRRNLPLPDDTTEQQLASLLHDNTCFESGDDTTYPTNLFLRCHVCYSCEKKLVILKGSKIRNNLVGLHPQARHCVRFSPGNASVAKPQPEYLARDLWAASAVLFDLAEQDDRAKKALKASSRSKRAKGHVDTAGDPDKLDTYLEEKKEWVKKEQEMSKKLHDVIKAEKDTSVQDRVDAMMRVAAEHKAEIDRINLELETNHGWSRPQLDWHANHSHFAGVPNRPPAEDPAGWATFRDVVQGEIVRRAAIDAETAARQARLDSIKPYYESFKAAQLGVIQNVVPAFGFFLGWTSVKPLWDPVDAAPLSDRMWARALSAVRQDFVDYQEKVRVAAIRAILKATTGTMPASTDPSDYPESTYDHDWFARPTAHFFGEMVFHLPGYVSHGPYAYPDTLHEHKCVGSRVEWFAEHINAHQVRLVRLVLDAIGETDDSVTVDILCELGAVWRWNDSPYKSKKEKERRYSFTELIYALKRRGPKPTQLARGENVPVISLWDDVDECYDSEMEEMWATGLYTAEECLGLNEAALEDPGCG